LPRKGHNRLEPVSRAFAQIVRGGRLWAQRLRLAGVRDRDSVASKGGTDRAVGLAPEDTMAVERPGITLVAMEAGSDWPSWVELRSGDDVMVITQNPDAAPSELVERVQRKLSGIARAGRELSGAVMALNGRRSPARDAACLEIGRAFVAHPRRAQATGVVLSCPEHASPAARANLLELTAAILRDIAGREVSASLRFHAPAQSAA
jgi:hypothetical protein